MQRLAPAAVNDAGAWTPMFGDWTLASTPNAGNASAVLERRHRDAPADVELVATIAHTGAAQNGSERVRGYEYRLRCSAFTSAGAVFNVRVSGLVTA